MKNFSHNNFHVWKLIFQLPTPEREDEVTGDDDDQDELELTGKTHTASKMLSVFRQLEGHKEQRPVGPKPLKRFTPPPDSERRIAPNDESGPEYSESEYDDEEEECEEEESEEEQDPNYVKSSHKNVDEFLRAAQSAERAKQLREKFEKWEKNEIKKEMNNSSVNLFETTTDDGQMETAKRWFMTYSLHASPPKHYSFNLPAVCEHDLSRCNKKSPSYQLHESKSTVSWWVFLTQVSFPTRTRKIATKWKLIRRSL